MRKFEGGATRDTDTGKLKYEGFFAPRVLHAYARYMHRHRKQRDGSFRDPDNWTQGMPVEVYMDSLVRHTMDLWREWREHGRLRVSLLCAIMFNAMGLVFELTKPKSILNHGGQASGHVRPSGAGPDEKREFSGRTVPAASAGTGRRKPTRDKG